MLCQSTELSVLSSGPRPTSEIEQRATNRKERDKGWEDSCGQSMKLAAVVTQRLPTCSKAETRRGKAKKQQRKKSCPNDQCPGMLGEVRVKDRRTKVYIACQRERIAEEFAHVRVNWRTERGRTNTGMSDVSVCGARELNERVNRKIEREESTAFRDETRGLRSSLATVTD